MSVQKWSCLHAAHIILNSSSLERARRALAFDRIERTQLQIDADDCTRVEFLGLDLSSDRKKISAQEAPLLYDVFHAKAGAEIELTAGFNSIKLN